MRRYIYIACAILVAIILIEALRLISNRMSKDSELRKFIEKNRTILILLVSIILSLSSFALFELNGAPFNSNNANELKLSIILTNKIKMVRFFSINFLSSLSFDILLEISRNASISIIATKIAHAM